MSLAAPTGLRPISSNTHSRKIGAKIGTRFEFRRRAGVLFVDRSARLKSARHRLGWLGRNGGGEVLEEGVAPALRACRKWARGRGWAAGDRRRGGELRGAAAGGRADTQFRWGTHGSHLETSRRAREPAWHLRPRAAGTFLCLCTAFAPQHSLCLAVSRAARDPDTTDDLRFIATHPPCARRPRRGAGLRRCLRL